MEKLYLNDVGFMPALRNGFKSFFLFSLEIPVRNGYNK